MAKPDARTIPALLDDLVRRAPQADFLVDGARHWSYRQFSVAVAQAARALMASGIARGDRVGILMGNRAEWLVLDFAAMSIGAIAVGLNTWATASELAYQLEHAGVKALFIEAMFRDHDLRARIAQARAEGRGLPALASVIVLDDDAPASNYGAFLARAERVTEGALQAARNQVMSQDVACLLYTSGSTALPKGVPLVHAGLIDNMWEIGERQRLLPTDRLWLAVSLFWSLGCVNAVFALVTHGACIVLQHHFDAAQALELIERERCTVFYGTPNMVLALHEQPSRAACDLSSLRTGVTIGTPEQVKRLAALGVPEICNVYGLTEAYGNSAVTDCALPLATRVQSVGRALAGVEIEILDARTGAFAPRGEVGEIALRGRVTPGYWRDPERSAEVFTSDGYFRTGDLGYLDADGFLYYRGRLKEMVKTGGINVAPAEVEEVLGAHPAVELVFVTGIPDRRLDEALAAVIITRHGQVVDAASLLDYCRTRLAAYKVPRQIRFVSADALPLTTTGKLQRNRLPELFTCGASTDAKGAG